MLNCIIIFDKLGIRLDFYMKICLWHNKFLQTKLLGTLTFTFTNPLIHSNTRQFSDFLPDTLTRMLKTHEDPLPFSSVVIMFRPLIGFSGTWEGDYWIGKMIERYRPMCFEWKIKCSTVVCLKRLVFSWNTIGHGYQCFL